MKNDDEPANDIRIFHQQNGDWGGAKQKGEEKNQQSDEDWSKKRRGDLHLQTNKKMSQAKVLTSTKQG